MSKHAEKIQGAADKLFKYTTDQLRGNEYIIKCGFAILTGWRGPKRCFVSMTNERMIVIWLDKRYDKIQTTQDIPFTNIDSFSYKQSNAFPLFPSYFYNQRPFTPRLYIWLVDNRRFAFAFNDQDVAKTMIEELRRRLPSSGILR